MHTTYLSPDEIQKKNFFHIVRYMAPQENVFSTRAARFRQLAQETQNDWQHYLMLMAEVADVQDRLLQKLSPVDIFEKADVANKSALHALLHKLSASDKQPKPRTLSEKLQEPLNVEFLSRQEALLPRLLKDFSKDISPQLPQQSKAALNTLVALDSPALLELTQKVFNGLASDEPADETLWLNAVLQILFTKAAMPLHEDIIETDSMTGFCPACGTDAVSAVILNKSDSEGLRYMHCPTCNSRWHVIRTQCSFCSHTGQLLQYSLPDTDVPVLSGAVAEGCQSCGNYRKTFLLSKQHLADPIADDLASLALDIKMTEEGEFTRGGANPFLMNG